MKHDFCASYKNVSLRPLHRCDIEKLRFWRNDKELNKFLRPIPIITIDAQKKWYESYLANSGSYLFSVIDNDNEKMIGTIGIIKCDKSNEAEIGQIIIGDESERGKGIGYKSLIIAACIGFKEMGVRRYRLRVFKENTIALNLYVKAGFQKLGSHIFADTDRVEYDMSITLEGFKTKNQISDSISLYRETSEESDRLENVE